MKYQVNQFFSVLLQVHLYTYILYLCHDSMSISYLFAFPYNDPYL